MKREKEIELLENLQGLKNSGLFFLSDSVSASPVERYASAERFDQEVKKIFRALPLIAAHGSELPEPGSFVTRELMGLPVLISRDKAGEVRAFLNVCRHRGARLVSEPEGCKHAFSCPYHAWTWANDGRLRGIPHEKPGFPGIDREAYGLKRLPATERLGVVWVIADPKSEYDIDGFIDPLESDFEWMDMQSHMVAETHTVVRNANWKLLIEGGIEAYHFKVTHKDTIGPHFQDNLSSYEMLGDHMRSILPRNSLNSWEAEGHESQSIRDHANVLYSVFPTSQFLLMQDHIAWIDQQPIAHDKTRLRLTTLAPKDKVVPEMADHWKRNHKITSITLDEDFEVNEATQAGVNTGTNEALTFGRYEGALDTFNKLVERYLD